MRLRTHNSFFLFMPGRFLQFYFVVVLLCLLHPVSAQTHCIRGQVMDKESGIPVSDVNIWENVTGTGTITDSLGVFELCGLEGDKALLLFSHTAYIDTSLVMDTRIADSKYVTLTRKEIMAGEVEVRGRDGSAVNKVAPGQGRLKSADIMNLPALLGEADVVRALQQMTGIQSVSEGIGGIYVRGGGPGQNKVLLDGMELMNPVHLMGVYSVFNPLITSGVDVFKGHAPVSVRSGLSSAILVSSANPLNEQNQVAGSLGNLASNLTLSQMSKNGKIGITAGFRRSYLELYKEVASLFLDKKDNYFERSFYSFYDFNGKIVYKPGSSSSLSFSWYLGADDFMIDNEDLGYDAGTNYGNRALRMQWKQRFGINSILVSEIAWSNAWSDFDGEIIDNDLAFRSNHERYAFKSHVLVENDRHLIKTGFEAFYYKTMPQDMTLVLLEDTTLNKDHFRNADVSIFFEDTYEILPRWSLYTGLRGFYYMILGPYDYQDEGSAIQVSKNKLHNGAFYWMPCLAVSYHPHKGKEYRLAWSRNVQMMHLASLSSMPLPNDIWMMTSPKLEPQTGHQFSLEYQRELPGFSFSAGAFGRIMQNQLVFKVNLDGEETNFEDHFYHGKGRAYGMEISAKKESGALQGSINYTLSRSERSFPDIFNGEWFSDKFDRTHDLSLLVSYNVNKKWKLGANWTYATGNTMTLPAGRMWMMGTIMNDYDGYNNFRLPPYHRLDVSAGLNLKSNIFKESVLDFSIINVYNRANPYFLFYKVYKGDSNYDINIKASQVSLFPIMPSVSWKFKF
jgi:hypothetical protein